MSAIAFPEPKSEILALRDEIIAGLTAIVGSQAVISTENERRAYETDALTAYRSIPLAVALPASTRVGTSRPAMTMSAMTATSSFMAFPLRCRTPMVSHDHGTVKGPRTLEERFCDLYHP